MPVQLPRLKRIAPSGEAPAPERIRGQVQDQSAGILGRTRALSALAGQGLEAHKGYENDKIKTLSYEAEKEYSEWEELDLQKRKAHEGDPTDAYADHEIESQKKYDEIINERYGLSDRVRKGLESNLSRVRDTNRAGVLRQSGLQQRVYKTKLYNSTMKLRQNKLPDLASAINEDDKGSFEVFDRGLASIRNLVIENAIDDGVAEATKDEDGNITSLKMSSIGNERVAEAMIKGVSSTIEVMIASGEVGKAKLMREKYKQYLDPKTRARIDSKFKTAGVSDDAYKKLAKYRGLKDDEIVSKISTEKDGKVRDKMELIHEARVTRRKKQRDRKFKKNHEAMFNKMADREEAGNPYLSKEELFSDPLYKEIAENFSPNDRKSLIKQVMTPPTESSDKDIQAIQSVLFEGNFSKLTPAEFGKLVAPLAKGDRNRYRNMYEKSKTGGEGSLNSRVVFANKLIKDIMLGEGDLKFSDYSSGLHKDSKILMSQVRTKFIEFISDLETIPSEKEVQEMIIPFINDMKVNGILKKKQAWWKSDPEPVNEFTKFSKKTTTTKESRRERLRAKIKAQREKK